ncbi:MAG: hypothetical protein WC346_11865 [Methanogenium sp.]|jgi:hypothetical protein
MTINLFVFLFYIACCIAKEYFYAEITIAENEFIKTNEQIHIDRGIYCAQSIRYLTYLQWIIWIYCAAIASLIIERMMR